MCIDPLSVSTNSTAEEVTSRYGLQLAQMLGYTKKVMEADHKARCGDYIHMRRQLGQSTWLQCYKTLN